MNDLDEIVAEFLVESHENLDQMDRDLVALEQDPTSRPLLGSIFRTIHTIKGTTGFLGFSQLMALTHAGESLLSELRDGPLTLTAEVTRALLQLVDAVRALLSVIEDTGGEGQPDHGALIAELVSLRERGVTTPAAPPPSTLIGEVIVRQGAATPDAVSLAATAQDVGDPRPMGEILVSHGSTRPGDVSQALHTQADHRSLVDRSIRVDVDLLDSLMRMVGELVLTRNQIVSHAGLARDAPLVRASARLNSIVTGLQEGVMKTRMQPIDNVWSKLPRLVRDLGVTCGKTVRLDLQGQDTELDKTILEAVKDPLTHLVRNAVDHGIELPAARLAAGKDPQGLLSLRAYHEGGQVVVDIRDDGGGIDPAAIRATARERGLVTDDQLALMGDPEIGRLIFLPGLSTAEQVTSVSGRGVGMDVVKTNIEAVGGTVDVASVLGEGTLVRVKIPLTLAIIEVLTVTCHGLRYAIPQINLTELVRLADDSAVEAISGIPVYRLRGRLLPVVALDRELALAPCPPGDRPDGRVIAVLEVDGERFGLLVDDVLDIEEIVVKPLGAQLRGLRIYAGATILGDGGVVLILDIAALAEQAHVLRVGRPRADRSLDAEAGVRADEPAALLVASIGADSRVGIALDLVTRLERLPARSVERVGGREVVQYRGQILPLVWLAELLDSGSPRAAPDALEVVVCSDGRGRSVGLVVDAIHDVEASSARSDLGGRGLVGSAVLAQRVTQLLDVGQAIHAADRSSQEPIARESP